MVLQIKKYFGLCLCILKCRESKGGGSFSCLSSFFFYFEPKFPFVVPLLISPPEETSVCAGKMDDRDKVTALWRR